MRSEPNGERSPWIPSTLQGCGFIEELTSIISVKEVALPSKEATSTIKLPTRRAVYYTRLISNVRQLAVCMAHLHGGIIEDTSDDKIDKGFVFGEQSELMSCLAFATVELESRLSFPDAVDFRNEGV